MEKIFNLYYDWAKSLGMTRVANISNFVSTGVYVAMAVRLFSKTLTVHQGKGLSVIEAQISALGESIETALASKSDNKQIMMSSAISDLLSTPKTAKQFTSSGGLAIHVKEESAIMHGLEEVIERPLAKNFLTKLTAKRVINKDIMTDFLSKKNINWKIFSDLNFYELDDSILNSIAVLISVKDDIRGKLWFVGFGSRNNFFDACLAAVTEAVQTYVTYIVGMRDDLPIITQENVSKPISITTIYPELKKVPRNKKADINTVLNFLQQSNRYANIKKIGEYSAYGVTGVAIKCIEVKYEK